MLRQILIPFYLRLVLLLHSVSVAFFEFSRDIRTLGTKERKKEEECDRSLEILRLKLQWRTGSWTGRGEREGEGDSTRSMRESAGDLRRKRKIFQNSIESVSFYFSLSPSSLLCVVSNPENERKGREERYRLVTIKLVSFLLSFFSKSRKMDFFPFRTLLLIVSSLRSPAPLHFERRNFFSLFGDILFIWIQFLSEHWFLHSPSFLSLHSESEKGRYKEESFTGKTLILKEISYNFWFTSNATELKWRMREKCSELFFEDFSKGKVTIIHPFLFENFFRSKMREMEKGREKWMEGKESKDFEKNKIDGKVEDESLFWFINLNGEKDRMGGSRTIFSFPSAVLPSFSWRSRRGWRRRKIIGDDDGMRVDEQRERVMRKGEEIPHWVL